MLIQELVPLGPQTTMRIGGKALYYSTIATEKDAEDAYAFSREKNIPLIVLGGGSNTIFADYVINALVVRIKADNMTMENSLHPRFGPEALQNRTVSSVAKSETPTSFVKIIVQAGKTLGSLLNDLAAHNLDMSALAGIPGTVGGAIFGNAGQGPNGVWTDAFVESVTAIIDGEWKTLKLDECDFRYRESKFKDISDDHSVIIWNAVLNVPSRPEDRVKAEIERLLKKRIETQPHIKTAGSCFKSFPDGTPAWQFIDKAGLRGVKIGGVQISEKHANFLLNVDNGTFEDALAIAKLIRNKVPSISGIEMRFYEHDGRIAHGRSCD